MRILGIDTSSHLNCVGLIDGERILADFAWEAMDNSLQRIIGVIDSVLTKQGLTIADIDGLGVGIGPGSWTGVRIGVTVGKTLAYATSKPVCGISSLEALAYQAKDTTTQICSLIDGGKETIYGAFYRPQEETITRTGEYYAGDLKKLLERIEEPTLFLGEAAYKYQQIIVEQISPLAIFGDELKGVQKGSDIAFLALSRLKRGGSDDALSLTPLYLREFVVKARLAGRTGLK